VGKATPPEVGLLPSPPPFSPSTFEFTLSTFACTVRTVDAFSLTTTPRRKPLVRLSQRSKTVAASVRQRYGSPSFHCLLRCTGTHRFSTLPYIQLHEIGRCSLPEATSILSEESTNCSRRMKCKCCVPTFNVPGVKAVGRDLDLSLMFVIHTREGRQNGVGKFIMVL
jgi:hypothetical protein